MSVNADGRKQDGKENRFVEIRLNAVSATLRSWGVVYVSILMCFVYFVSIIIKIPSLLLIVRFQTPSTMSSGKKLGNHRGVVGKSGNRIQSIPVNPNFDVM